MEYDSLHIEIDNDAAERNLHPLEALEVWQMGVEQWEKKYNQPPELTDIVGSLTKNY